MKKYLSVLALEVRSSIYKVCGIMILMTLTQTVDYILVLRKIIKEREGWNSPVSLSQIDGIMGERLTVTFSEMVSQCHARWIFAAAVVLISLVFIWSSSERGKSKTKFCLWRLRISERKVFALSCTYHIIIYLVLVAVQILLVLWMHQLYQMKVGMGRAPQALLLIFYRDGFLHGLLPLSDGVGFLRLICYLSVLGIGTAYIGYMGFSAKRNACSVVGEILIFIAVLFAAGDILQLTVFGVLVSMITIAAMIYSILGKREV